MDSQLVSDEPRPTGVTWRFKVLYKRHLELLEEEKMAENNLSFTNKEKSWKHQSKLPKKNLRSISAASSNQSSNWASNASHTFTLTSFGDTTRSNPSTFNSNQLLNTRGLVSHKSHFGLDQEILASA